MNKNTGIMVFLLQWYWHFQTVAVKGFLGLVLKKIVQKRINVSKLILTGQIFFVTITFF